MVIAERGLAGMSMRTVAEQADMSVGSISYRIGDRAALVAAVIDREMALADVAAQKFLARLDGIEPVMAGLLPDLVGAWLDLLAGEQRISAIVTCELALFASRYSRTALQSDTPNARDRTGRAPPARPVRGHVADDVAGVTGRRPTGRRDPRLLP